MSEDLFVEAGDARLAVRIDGPAGAPWLILSNSLATDMRMWEPQIAELSAHRRIVRYDTRGHGRSSAPSGPYRFDLWLATSSPSWIASKSKPPTYSACRSAA